MSTLPPDLIKIRNELVEEHKLLTKDNGIESSSYHFKAGFNAAARILLEREAKQKAYGLEQFRLAQKLQADLDLAIEALKWYSRSDLVMRELGVEESEVEIGGLAQETLAKLQGEKK